MANFVDGGTMSTLLGVSGSTAGGRVVVTVSMGGMKTVGFRFVVGGLGAGVVGGDSGTNTPSAGSANEV